MFFEEQMAYKYAKMSKSAIAAMLYRAYNLLE